MAETESPSPKAPRGARGWVKRLARPIATRIRAVAGVSDLRSQIKKNGRTLAELRAALADQARRVERLEGRMVNDLAITRRLASIEDHLAELSAKKHPRAAAEVPPEPR